MITNLVTRRVDVDTHPHSKSQPWRRRVVVRQPRVPLRWQVRSVTDLVVVPLEDDAPTLWAGCLKWVTHIVASMR